MSHLFTEQRLQYVCSMLVSTQLALQRTIVLFQKLTRCQQV